MRRIVAICVLFLVGLAFAEDAPGLKVRVRLFSAEQPSVIRVTTSNGQAELFDAAKMTNPFRGEGPIEIEREGANRVRVEHPIEVSARNGKLVIVVIVPLEDYVAAVLAGEASGFRSMESLKAMAVAVRSYALHFLHRHKADGFDFCDTTHCQDFRITAVTQRERQAAETTKGEVLRYDGTPIAAYYHQNCGGTTEPHAPYLRYLRDPFCISRSSSRWFVQLTTSDLEKALSTAGIYNVEVIERSGTGRVQRLRINGQATRVITAEAFRLAVGRTAGWNKIRSDMYEIRRSANRFTFEGSGAGHGIGLCQDGAAVMGEMGYGYQEILAHYYSNASKVKAP